MNPLSPMLPIRWFRFAFILLLLLAGAASARELPSFTAWPHETGDVKPDPRVVWGRLANGMRYAVLPNATPKDRVSLRLLISAGSLMEQDDQRGLAHFLEHMAFQGTEDMPAGDLVQYLERLGMAFGADTNARTSFESTVYQLELPSNSPELLDRSLFVMRETADRMLIPSEALEKERGVVLSERRLRDTASYRSFVAGFEFLLPGTIPPQRWPIGTESVIQNAPRERLLDFYRRYYTPDRTTLVAVGAIEPTQFSQLIDKHFSSFRAQGPRGDNPDLGRIAKRGLETRLHYESEGRTSVSLSVVKPLPLRPDTHARRLQEITLYLANSIVSRRLDTLALQADAGFLSGAAQSDDFLEFARIGYVLLRTQPSQWRKALSIAETELRRALTYGFTAAELEEQKKTLLAHFQEESRGAATRESSELAEALVRDLTEGRVTAHPADDLRYAEQAMQAITPDAALRELRSLWQESGPLVFVSGPIELDNAQSVIAQAFADSRARPVSPPVDNAVQKFAYTDFGSPTPVVERHVTDAMQVTQLRFGNNVRVNLKRTDFEANSILVSARIGAGRLELPQDKPGLKELAESAFVSGGLVAHSVDELNRLTAGRTVGLNFDVEDDAFVLGGSTTPDDLLLQLQLLAAYTLAPGYRTEALARFRQGLPQLYQSLERTPVGVLQKDVARFLRSGDARFGYPSQAALEALTLEDLRATLAQPLSRGYLEISLVGDFDMETAVAAVAATFGSLPMREAANPPYEQAREVHFPRERRLTTFTYDTVDPKALSMVYWPTTDISHVTEVRRLYVLAKVLGNRVLERVRNEQGLTYSAQGAHAPSQAFPGYGFLYAAVDAEPGKARTLAEEIRDIGSAVHRDGITQDELDRARNPVVSELKRLLSTNGYMLSAVVAGSQEKPEKLERATTSLKEIESLTVDKLNRVARQYLVPTAALPIVIVPRQTADKSAKSTVVRETVLTD